MTNRINKQAVDLIKASEGCELSPYICAGGYVTIGYGTTRGRDGRLLTLDHPPIEQLEADLLFERDIGIFSRQVARVIKVPVSENQFGALVSFAYNVGVGNMRSSTLLRKLNRGDYIGCANEFWKWRRSRGKILRGLVRRRELERKLFCSSDVLVLAVAA